MVFQNTKKIMKIFLKKILAKNSSQHQLNIIKFHVVEKIQNHIRYMKYHFYYYKKKSFSDRQTRNPNIQWRKSSIINIPCQENGKISRQFWQASKILQRCNCRLNLLTFYCHKSRQATQHRRMCEKYLTSGKAVMAFVVT